MSLRSAIVFFVLACAGCSGGAGATCEFDSDCQTGLQCSNCGDRSTWPRGVCAASVECAPRADTGFVSDVPVDASRVDAPLATDSGLDAGQDAMSVDVGRDASTPDATADTGRDAPTPADAGRDAPTADSSASPDAPTDASSDAPTADAGTAT